MMDFAEQQREAEAIRADMRKTFSIINDAKTRYIKAKLKTKSKKRAEDEALMFAELDGYSSENDIIDAYGYGDITDATRERLLNLWVEREQYAKNGSKYHDRVIDMLDKAIAHIGDDHLDFLDEADRLARENDRNQAGRF